MSRLYRQRPASFLRLLMLVLLCLVLMALDQKKLFIPRVKSALELVVIPLEYAVVWPGQALATLRDYLMLQHQLVYAEHHWQDQRLLLEAQLQQVNALKIQNQQLQALLDSPVVEHQQDFLLAKVLSLKSDAFGHEILLDRGSRADITVGQAIIASEGIAGQIIDINPFNSRAILITDTRSAVPVVNQRSQENFIVVGTGAMDQLGLMNVSSSADLHVGDVLISSGMGGHFPAGYPVGVVTAIDSHTKALAGIHIKPAVALTKLRLVIIPFEV